MPISLLFWILYLLALFFGIFPQWPGAIAPGQPRTPYFVFGGSLLFFVLVGLLGWHDFGAPLQNH